MIWQQAQNFQDRIAIQHEERKWTFKELIESSNHVAGVILNKSEDLNENRVAFMVAPGFDYVCVQWGIWIAGGVAVPLSLDYPTQSLEYVIDDTQTSLIVTSKQFEPQLVGIAKSRNIKVLFTESIYSLKKEIGYFPSINPERRAMILYTSGTTNLPKGVVTTHRNLLAQIEALIIAWEWTSNDHILCVLPLHHVHGIINVVSCSLYSGACCEFLTPFSAQKAFEIFKTGRVNVFMAVPTIYYKLIAFYEQTSDENKSLIKNALVKFRLMVSGSAALPVSIMEKWFNLCGHWLLERYGMTEIGMGISNPYYGERRPGHIGKALPGVNARLCNDNDEVVNNEPGEIQIKGENVFKEYWRNPEATQKSFTKDGWFKTGDIAEVVDGYYRILGRSSVDIIKSGGYKISALEIEEILRSYPDLTDCSVVGIENEEWGEIVAAAFISPVKIKSDDIFSWMADKMPKYKLPRLFKQVEDLPRNAMGKVIKNDLKKIFKNG